MKKRKKRPPSLPLGITRGAFGGPKARKRHRAIFGPAKHGKTAR
jgi:hypothetical protein